MSNTAQSLASTRIASLLDENSFVEIGGYVTARSTDFNMQQTETPGDGVVTGYGVIDGQPGICLQSGCFRTGRHHRRDARKEDCGSV